jgi:prephenate dehydrogenase
MRTVAIVGVGLIGGSFGLAMRKAGFEGSILGVSSERSIAQAVGRGAIDKGVTLEEAGTTADLIFLSQPILGIVETIGKLDAVVRRDALVTDAGSTKQIIVEEARHSLTRCAFLGGHAMAGKELRGAASADADLF